MAQDQNTAVAFLKGSSPLIEDFQGPAGGPTQTYAATAGRLTWNSKDGSVGLAEGIRIKVAGTFTPTLGTGAAIWSQMRSFFTAIRVKQGGTTIKEWHPYGYELLRTRIRRNVFNPNAISVTASYSSPTGQFPLGSALPAITGAAPINFAYTFFIPLRRFKHLLIGMLQCGDNTNPMVLECDVPSTLYSTDPEAAPVTVSGNATVAFNATVTATYVYRRPFTYVPGQQVQAPQVGYVIRDAQNSVAIAQVGADIPIPHKNLYPHISVTHVVEDGNSDAATPATGLSTAEVSKFLFQLTEELKVINLDTNSKIEHFLAIQREIYGQDAPDGVFTYDPYILNYDTALLSDVDLQDPHQIPDFQVWSNAASVFQIKSGTTINTNPGQARIRTFSEYMLPVKY